MKEIELQSNELFVALVIMIPILLGVATLAMMSIRHNIERIAEDIERIIEKWK